nr:ankyrin repeat domain-containing protein SOWAHC-like isoform X7 [Chrysemys picta bellii]
MPARQCLAYSRDQRHQQGPGLPFQERAACGRDLGQASPRPAGRRSFPLALGGPVPEPLPGRPPPWTDQPRAWLLPPEAPSPPSQPALQPPHPQATPSQPPLGCACPVLALWAQPVPRVALRERPGAAPSSAGRWGLWEPGRDEPGGCTRAELGARYPGRAAPLRGAASWAGPCAPGPARRSARPSAERSCWSSAGRRPRSGTPLPAQPHEAFMELGKKLALVRQGQGEKYVGLKRRSQGAAPGPPAGMALWEAPQAGPEEEAALPHILVTDFSASSTAAWGSLEGVPATAPDPQPESEPPRAAEEDAESVSKPRAPPSLPLPLLSRQPESEQDASEDGGSSLGSSSVALDPVEKEWLQGAASGHLLTLSHLLKQEPSLATRKDFTSFTALHWAAKHGKEDLVSLLVAAGADVNTRSGGYTPLHIAALHGHRQVMDLLVRSYGAKQNVRDHSGHLARHYLGAEKPLDRDATLPQLPAVRGRNRALACLLLPKGSGQARKRWGSAEDLTEEEERGQAQHLAVPASYRAVRKFSR